jgi:tetratricopeptide (TPR) repeat protein
MRRRQVPSHDGEEESLITPEMLTFFTQKFLNKPINSLTDISLLNQLGAAFEHEGMYEEAGICYEYAVDEGSVVGEGHEEMAISYCNLALIEERNGAFTRAIQLLEAALKIYILQLGPMCDTTANVFNRLGLACYRAGDFGRAIEYHNRDLSYQLSISRGMLPEAATCYSNLGLAHCALGNMDASIECHQRAIIIRAQELGPDHVLTATSYNNLGSAYFRKNQFGSSLEYFLRALAIRTAVYGDSHIEVANSLNNIGMVYCNIGDLNLAEKHLKAAIAILRACPPEEIKSQIQDLTSTLERVLAMQWENER